MEDIHVHAENRFYKVYGPGPATILAQMYAHLRGLGTLWLLSIIPFVIVYINTFNVQYGVTVSFFIVLIEIGKHLCFYDGPPRAFLVLDYYPSDESESRGNLPRNDSENSVSESNEPSEPSEETEETTIETSCEGDGIVDESPCETDGAVGDHPCEGDVTPCEGTGEEDTQETTEKNETQNDQLKED